MTVENYDSVNAIMISDHRPVFAQFSVKLYEIKKEVSFLILSTLERAEQYLKVLKYFRPKKVPIQ